MMIVFSQLLLWGMKRKMKGLETFIRMLSRAFKLADVRKM